MSFFEEYFVNPIVHREGYNIINTTAYAILFLLFSMLAYKILKKLKIKTDFTLAVAITPFILSAIIIRVLNDAGIIKGYIFVTPNIWILSFFIIISIIAISHIIQKKFNVPYYKTMFVFGFSIFSFLLGTIKINNAIALIYIVALLPPLIFMLLALKTSTENRVVLGIQTFDSIVTAVSIEWFGYVEQHVVPRVIINFTGTAFSFVLVKFLVVYISLMIIDKNDDEDFNKFIKLLIAILGLSTGGRDLLRLLWGV